MRTSRRSERTPSINWWISTSGTPCRTINERKDRTSGDGNKTIIALAEGRESTGRLDEDLLPCRPTDEKFEDRLKARLRRYVVERCLYGVDLDPLAIELAKIALWIETMDRELPFSFLDHKFKCGNALVGCWFDRFRHYPVMAWLREGGDKNHTTAVHFKKDARTKAIKAHLKDVIKPDLIAWIERFRDTMPMFIAAGKTAQQVHDEALAILEQMHHLPPGEDGEHRRAELHRQLRESPAYVALKRAFDLWCALWFWPADDLAAAPKPSEFAAPRPESIEAAERIAAERRFFHWELEFPDVFAAKNDDATPHTGFSAIIGNPPWDTLEPKSKEWFNNVDPLFRAYGKQEALAKQRSLFAASEQVENDWLEFNAFFKDTANWVKASERPFGDRLNVDDNGKEKHDFSLGDRGRSSLESSKARHSAWTKQRAIDIGYADPEHPFALQGDGKPYTYQLFTELALALLKTDGRLGFIVPSALYTHHGSSHLRTVLLDRCRWEWLFGFENRDGIFDIHRSEKFNPVIILKGPGEGGTKIIRTAFMQRDPDDWALGVAEALAVPYARAQVERFSPRSKAIIEIRSAHDLAVLEKIYADSVLLSDHGPDGWGIRYSQGDFNMTSDSALFPRRPKWEERGYRPDEYSRWIKGDWRPVSELLEELRLSSTSPIRRGPGDDAPFHNAPPYQTLPVPRADLPPGVILSRDITAFIHEADIDWEVETVVDDNGNEVEVRHRAVALPLYQGAMIWQLDAAVSDYRAGASHSTRWTARASYEPFLPEPQFVIGSWRGGTHSGRHRIGFRAVQNATNQRTLVATLLPNALAGHSMAMFSGNDANGAAVLTAILTSFVTDSVLRPRMSQANLSSFVVQEVAVPATNRISKVCAQRFADITLRLCGPVAPFSSAWMKVRGCDPHPQRSFRIAALPHERLRLRCILDAAVAALYGLDLDDLKWILKDCDHPVAEVTNRAFARKLDPKGFWRVDKAEPPERRHTVLTLAAFADLQALIAAGIPRDDAIAAFCGQSRPDQPLLPQVDGLIGSIQQDGWMLPDHFRLADLGLGHDDRAQHPQPVAPALGPRFYDWQLAQDPAESWRECELHARNLLGEEGFERLKAELEGRAVPEATEPNAASQSPKRSKSTDTPTLFG